MKYKINQNYLTLIIDTQFENKTIDDVFNHFKLSKKSIHLLKQNKEYFLNHQFVPSSTLLKQNDCLSIKAYTKDTNPFISQYLPLDILYEDEFLLIINKPAGMNVHPDSKDGLNTLCNYVQCYYDISNYHFPVRYIHRLDYDTSGLIMFCKCHFLQAYLDHELFLKNIKRTYLALVEGKITQKKLQTIDTFLAKDRHVSNKMRVSLHGQRAITHYQIISNSTNLSLVKCVLDTGRTHQIRVHMSYIHHPIIGDELYGKPTHLIHRQALHAYQLELIHPITTQSLLIESPLPQDMATIQSQLK